MAIFLTAEHCVPGSMSELPRSRSRTTGLFAVFAVVVLLLMSAGPGTVRADEIPHENYELVGSNIDVIIAMLQTSIDYSEYALMAMYNESMADVTQNLTVVTGILSPAERLLSQIQNIAGSYENLSRLLPPFWNLATGENSFAAMEWSLLVEKTKLVSASTLPVLTGEQLIEALNAITKVGSLIVNMNNTIDEMLVSAADIIALTVEETQPFTNNSLIPLIEKLRELLMIELAEIDRIIQEEIPWGTSNPFLLFYLDKSRYYLGETIKGGGYLYFNGSFAVNHGIDILMDGQSLATVTTGLGGKYSFSQTIPINASWLGAHSFQARSDTVNGTLYSDVITITIVLIPTSITISPSDTLMSFEDQLTVGIRLVDVRGTPLIGAPCFLTVDGSSVGFVTDDLGREELSWAASELGYGRHYFQAFYEGELPYAPSSSANVEVIVDIPTSMDVKVYSERFRVDFDVLGEGHLYSNGTTPMSSQNITILIDGHPMANSTTDETGKYVFSFPAESLAVGAHVLAAAFINRDPIWRYSEAETTFEVFALKPSRYPFFPFIPGWGDLSPGEFFPYLFIGPDSYFTWLLILALLAITVKVMQLRKRRIERVKATASEVIRPFERLATPAPSAGLTEQFALDLSMYEKEAPATPNERIIWYYQRLLAFLSGNRMIDIRDTMTHWEVARLLKSLGYPLSPVQSATVLFEQALYSGERLSDTETVMMSTAMSNIVRIRTPEVANAG